MSATLTVPLLAPVAVGVKLMLIVQVPLTARLEGLTGQLVVWAKSPLFVPAMTMLVIVSGALPVFESVTTWATLLLLSCWFPNAMEVGVKLAAAAVPAPVRLIVWGLPVALSLKVSVAARAPLAVGVNVTLMVQLAAGATRAPQLLVWAKSPLFAPVTAMPVRLSGALPVSVRVTA